MDHLREQALNSNRVARKNQRLSPRNRYSNWQSIDGFNMSLFLARQAKQSWQIFDLHVKLLGLEMRSEGDL